MLEIGPGLGFLTYFLLQAGARVRAFETDAGLADWLEEIFEGESNFSLVRGDFLQADCSIYDSAHKGLDCPDARGEPPISSARVIANLPYNITTPVFERLFSLSAISDIIVMIQKQVAERIVAEAGTKDYGALTLFAGFHAWPRLLFHVSPGNFHPAPSVYSSVINLKIRETRPLSGEAALLFFALVRAVFSSRRKVLRNSLRGSPFCGLDPAQTNCLLEASGINGEIRGEQLPLEDFVRLALAWEASDLPRPSCLKGRAHAVAD